MVLLWLVQRFSLRRLKSELSRAVLLALLIALSVALFIGIIRASQSSLDSFAQGIKSALGDELVEIRSKRASFSTKEISELNKILHRSFQLFPIMERSVVLKLNHHVQALQFSTTLSESQSIQVIGTDLLSFANLTQSSVSLSAINQEAAGPIFFTDSSAKKLKLQAEQTIYLKLENNPDQQLQVKILKDEFGSDKAVVDLKVFAKLNELKFDYLLLKPLAASQNITWQAAALNQIFSENAELSKFYALSTDGKRKQASQLLHAYRSNLLILVALAFVVALFIIYSSAEISTLNIRRELSVLRTIGLGRSSVLLLLLSEGLFIGVLGTALGLSVAAPLSQFLVQISNSTVSELYFNNSEIKNYNSDLVTEFWIIFSALFLGLIVSVLGMLVPSIRASRYPPGMFTRSYLAPHEPNIKTRLILSSGLMLTTLATIYLAQVYFSLVLAYLGACLLFASFFALALPSLALLLLGSHAVLRRSFLGLFSYSSVRSNLSGAGLLVAVTTLGCCLMVSISVMVSSFRHTLLIWTQQTLKADLFISSLEPTDPFKPAYLNSKLLQFIYSNTTIENAARFSSISFIFNSRPITLAGSDLKAWQIYKNFELESGNLEIDELYSSKALLISEPLANKFRIGVGDSVQISCLRESRNLRVAGIYKDFSKEHGIALLPIELFWSCLDLNNATNQDSFERIESLSLYLKDPLSAPKLKQDIIKNFPELKLAINLNSDLRNNVMQIFDRTFLITGALKASVVLLSSLGFIVTMLQLLWERRTEYRTLTLIGADNNKIQLSIMLEGLLLLLPALLLGSISGLLLAWILIELINPIAFGWSFGWQINSLDLIVPALTLCSSFCLASFAPMLIFPKVIQNAKLSDE